MSKITRAILPFESRYAQIPNRILRDGRLSYKARGLLGVLLSHAHGFEITLESLTTERDGLSAVRTAVKELVSFGYLAGSRSFDPVTGKVTGYDWVLTDPGEE